MRVEVTYLGARARGGSGLNRSDDLCFLGFWSLVVGGFRVRVRVQLIQGFTNGIRFSAWGMPGRRMSYEYCSPGFLMILMLEYTPKSCTNC